MSDEGFAAMVDTLKAERERAIGKLEKMIAKRDAREIGATKDSAVARAAKVEAWRERMTDKLKARRAKAAAVVAKCDIALDRVNAKFDAKLEKIDASANRAGAIERMRGKIAALSTAIEKLES